MPEKTRQNSGFFLLFPPPKYSFRLNNAYSLGQKESAPRRCRRADGSLLGKSRERGRLSYWKLAFLFSRKAARPSSPLAWRRAAAWASVSSWSRSSRLVSKDLFMMSLELL